MIPMIMITLTIFTFAMGMIVGLHEQGKYNSQDKSITFKEIAEELFKH